MAPRSARQGGMNGGRGAGRAPATGSALAFLALRLLALALVMLLRARFAFGLAAFAWDGFALADLSAIAFFAGLARARRAAFSFTGRLLCHTAPVAPAISSMLRPVLADRFSSSRMSRSF